MIALAWQFNFLIALAVLIVPFVLGSYMARRIHMPDHGWRIGLSLCVFVTSLAVCLMGWPPKLGVDLSGGVILVYEIDRGKVAERGTQFSMEDVVTAIGRRVNPGGQKEVTVRVYGQDQFEIIIPNASDEEVRQIEKTISKAGTLEFRILANNRDDKELIERANQEDVRVVKSGSEILGWWVPIEIGQEQSILGYPEIAVRQKTYKGQKQWEVLVRNDAHNVTGDYLREASPDFDETGRRCVSFHFNSTGGDLFGRLTSENQPDKVQEFYRKLGIILDGNMHSAPRLQSTITDRGQISGNFSELEVKSLVNVLNSGKLPAALRPDPISRLYTGPTLGRDTIEKSSIAMIVSAILVPLFMFWYYRFSGLVANVALVLNMLALLAIMITIKAALTLPGLAGLALTVGMAVDNNVLVYERLREELERGASLRMAIRNAFQRASAVIIDANLTTLLASIVLYVIGTDQVKGFAVTLGIGVTLSMFTSVFVARAIFDVAEKQRWISQLKMLRLVGVTNINFMRLFPMCATASIIITVGAIVVAGIRGRSLFDIDFTGGVSVQTVFRQPQEVGEVRRLLSDLDDVAISDVRFGNEPAGLRFVVNTSEPDLAAVEQKIGKIFGDKLVTNGAKVENLAAIPATTEEKKPAATAPPNSPAPAGDKTPAAPASEKSPATPAAKETPKAPAKEPDKAPGKKDQSRRDLPPNSILAAGELSPMILAQALAAEEKAGAAKPAAEQAKPAAAAAQPATKPEATAPAAAKAEQQPAAPAGTAPAQPVADKPNPFAGGTQATLKFELEVNHKTLEEFLVQAMETTKIATDPAAMELTNEKYEPGESTAYRSWDVKLALPPEKAKIVFDAVQKQLQAAPFFPASSAIGGAVASGTRIQAVYALVASWLCMIAYLWIRFQKVAFGVAAVVALVHDVFVMLGALAISYWIAPYTGFLMIDQFKINLPIVAAFLTIIGFSVNDTIVIFDRIREVRGKDPKLTGKMVNDSVNQTMSRTLLTSFTVLLVVVVLYFFGGQAIHGFAFALIVGVGTGTYSSVYVAAPILLWLIGNPGEK